MDLIIGGGKYGEYAFRKLHTDTMSIVVLDTDPDCTLRQQHHLPETGGPGLTTLDIPAEGAVFIQGGIAEAADVITRFHPERIFPTVPVHVSAGVISAVAGFRPDTHGAAAMGGCIPDELVVGGNDADIYCSLNRIGRCPDRCPAPPVCPVTGIRRAKPLYTLLRESLATCSGSGAGTGPIPAVVMESHQFGPGLGYIQTDDLLCAITTIRESDAPTAWVATACRCHGVATTLSRDTP